MATIESPSRIEPALIDEPSSAIADVVADLTGAVSILGKFLHPLTAANLADAVRIMNTYYSNLIEGHNTRPRDIERALSGELDRNEARRNLQIEAAAHVRVQTEIDQMFLQGTLPSATSSEFIQRIHHEFYRDASPAMLTLKNESREIVMNPGQWRSRLEHDNAVGLRIRSETPRTPAFARA
jgi:Fic family protein